MKKLIFALLLLLTVNAYGQQPTPLMNAYIPGISTTTIIDNRPAQTRRLTYASIACSGTGAWQAALSYGSSSSGSWTSYGGSGIITQATSVPIAYGFKLVYPNYIRVAITGTATCNFSGFQNLYPGANTSSGTVTSVTVAGTSSQITATGTCSATDVISCTFSIPSAFVLPGTINGLTLTTSSGTFTLANSKTFSVLKTLTIDGTDGVTVTFPSSSATVATLGLTNTFTGRQDASGAASTAPAKVGTSLPASCTVGDQYFKSDATAGQNLYGCTSTNTWTVMSSSGSVTSVIMAGTSNQISVSGTCTITNTGTCTFSLPSGLVLPGTINGMTINTTTGTFTLANGKTFSVVKTITLDGTDGVTVTFPASSATVATLGLTNTFTGRQDASAAASTAPAKVGTNPPATCVVGDMFFDSNETAGANIYGCTATNTWTLQGGAGNPATVVATSFSTTPTFTASSNTANLFTMTLTGNVSSCTIASATAGQILTLRLTQDGTGTRTFACTGFSGLGSVDTTAAAVCTQPFQATSSSAAVATGPMTCSGTGAISIPGSTSGSSTIVAPATGGGTVTLFPGSDTVVGKATTDTLTNKTLTSPSINNGTTDLSSGTLRAPNSNTLPGTCSQGQLYQDNDATSGQRLYYCDATNTWSALGAGGGGGTSYFPVLSSIDNSSGWSDYGTALTVTQGTTTAAANSGVMASVTGGQEVRGRVKTLGSSTFSALFQLRIGLSGDDSEAGVVVKSSGSSSITASLRYSSASNRVYWVCQQHSSSTNFGTGETISSTPWDLGGAQRPIAPVPSSLGWGGLGVIYILAASTNGTTTTFRASYDGVTFYDVCSSTYVTPASAGWFINGNFQNASIHVGGATFN